jgi:hypothetical protein
MQRYLRKLQLRSIYFINGDFKFDIEIIVWYSYTFVSFNCSAPATHSSLRPCMYIRDTFYSIVITIDAKEASRKEQASTKPMQCTQCSKQASRNSKGNKAKHDQFTATTLLRVAMKEPHERRSIAGQSILNDQSPRYGLATPSSFDSVRLVSH